MLSKKEIKFIKSLQIKKYRDIERLFVVEGAKNILELTESDFGIESLYVTEDYFRAHQAKLSNLSVEPTIVKQQNIESAGTFTTNDAGLAVVRQRTQNIAINYNDFVIALDTVQDPGNLGTIIRTADWFGIDRIVCSKDTVDLYNPKVVNATMGSFFRVIVEYTDLNQYLGDQKRPVYGALLDGKSVYEQDFSNAGIILMGNESQGISDTLKKYITHPVTIPKFGKAESLNVAIATGIFCAQVRR